MVRCIWLQRLDLNHGVITMPDTPLDQPDTRHNSYLQVQASCLWGAHRLSFLYSYTLLTHPVPSPGARAAREGRAPHFSGHPADARMSQPREQAHDNLAAQPPLPRPAAAHQLGHPSSATAVEMRAHDHCGARFSAWSCPTAAASSRRSALLAASSAIHSQPGAAPAGAPARNAPPAAPQTPGKPALPLS